ncbi:Rieske 2Fe-2S domain-containing protein [Mucilaginibacter yixingensis]|uniref:Rieske 2Fe-2S domain-containing protein n=1 Tax=Mucilaginibacter yixingensis TaxID=1295612 RepID=UPI003CCB9EAB
MHSKVLSPANIEKYHAGYKSFTGQVCAGRRCPHFGTEMLEKDGTLVCPMHGLKANPATLVIY